jgi:hypothetical protein
MERETLHKLVSSENIRSKTPLSIEYQRWITAMLVNIEAQNDFIAKNQTFVDRLPNLKTAMDAAVFNVKMEELSDKVIYYLARIVFEDLNEIVILCANGLSTGGMKILRGMFERAVTVCYLKKFPEKVDLFWNFFPVHQRKNMMVIIENFPEAVSEEAIKKTNEAFEAVKNGYMITDCKKCGTKRLNHFWQKDHLMTMAKQAGGFDSVIFNGYYRPLEESHPSAAAIARRARATGENTFEYSDDPRPEEDYFTLLSAHFLVLKAMEAVKDHFKLENMEKPLERCLQDYIEIWKGSSPDIAPAETQSGEKHVS